MAISELNVNTQRKYFDATYFTNSAEGGYKPICYIVNTATVAEIKIVAYSIGYQDKSKLVENTEGYTGKRYSDDIHQLPSRNNIMVSQPIEQTLYVTPVSNLYIDMLRAPFPSNTGLEYEVSKSSNNAIRVFSCTIDGIAYICLENGFDGYVDITQREMAVSFLNTLEEELFAASASVPQEVERIRTENKCYIAPNGVLSFLNRDKTKVSHNIHYVIENIKSRKRIYGHIDEYRKRAVVDSMDTGATLYNVNFFLDYAQNDDGCNYHLTVKNHTADCMVIVESESLFYDYFATNKFGESTNVLTTTTHENVLNSDNIYKTPELKNLTSDYGYRIFNYSSRRPIYWDGYYWRDSNGYPCLSKDTSGNPIVFASKGETRPTFQEGGKSLFVGFCFFDTSIGENGKPIWWNGVRWVDSTGAAV